MQEPARMDTVTEDMQQLREQGFDLDADIRDGKVQFRVDGTWVPVAHAEVEEIRRYEGTSDPGDEMIVLGVHDRDSDRRGVLVAAYGPDTEPETADCLRQLLRRDT